MSFRPEKIGLVSVCVINYNGELYLEKTLQSLFTQKEKFEEILLVDNASEDKSVHLVKKRFSSVKIIKLDENFGPATARNMGFKHASCDRILFLDNDVSITGDCIEQLLMELDKNDRVAIVMPRIIYENKKNIVQYDGADSHYLGMMTLQNQDQPEYMLENSIKNITSLISACFVVDRKKIGLSSPFDDSFFIYFEDHDFGLKSKILGHDILAVPTACAYHREGTKGLSLRQSGRYSKRRVFFNIRNRWLTILKNYQVKTLILFSPIFFLYELFQIMGVIKKGWLVQWIKAIFWILLHPYEIFLKRRFVQKNRKISDAKILNGGNIPFANELGNGKIDRIVIKMLNYITTGYWQKINTLL